MAKTLVYQMWPRSWNNLEEMMAHLPRIKALGADYVWLSPLYPSPGCDHGYDIADYMAIDTQFGTMGDFDNFVETAHRLDLKVMMDLVLNHTSTKHQWFKSHPEYYCWDDTDRPGWKNLFDGGSAWALDAKRGRYYLHLFHEEQADLNWFPNGKINRALVKEFREIVKFWLKEHAVDGFRLDVPQCINKKLTKSRLDFSDLLMGDQSIDVINALFSGCRAPKTLSGGRPFLIMECFDPTYGDIIDQYAYQTRVDFFLNVTLKSAIDEGRDVFNAALDRSVASPYFMLDLESHDAPRFTSRSGLSATEIAEIMFESRADAICLYQGQELGLLNPSSSQLSDEDLCALDMQTAMRHARGESLDSLRPLSRANARVHLPLKVYDVPSVRRLYILAVGTWKRRP